MTLKLHVLRCSLFVCVVIPPTVSNVLTDLFSPASGVDLCSDSDDLPYSCSCMDPQFFDLLQSKMDCKDRNISELLDNIAMRTSVEVVDFSDNEIGEISATHFLSAESVQRLVLSNNNIQSIEESSFKSFGSLTTLDLSQNGLMALEYGTLEGLVNLVELDLSTNNIEVISAQVFVHVSSLKVLTLKNNNMVKVLSATPGPFIDLPLLQKLDLENTGLENLDENLFQNNSNLLRLNLAGNDFSEIPLKPLQSVRTSLQVLDVSATKLTAITESSLTGLTFLRTLHVNSVDTLQAIGGSAFSNLPSLETLRCSNNPRLKTIHGGAFRVNSTGFTSLRELYLSSNGLQTLDPRLVPWDRLTAIDLQDNPWVCDCSNKWMNKLVLLEDQERNFRCAHPHSLRGEVITRLPDESFVCETINPTEVSLFVVLGLLLFVAGIAVVVTITQNPEWRCVRAREQMAYARVRSSVDKVDLEWDHKDLTT